MSTIQRFYTTAQAAKKLHIKPSRVRQLILSGVLPAQKHGRAHLILPEDLEKARHRPGRGRPRKEPE